MNQNDVTSVSLIDFDILLNNNRTNDNRINRKLGRNTKLNKCDKIRITKEQNDNTLPSLIYRFKFTKEFMDELYNFSKIHQYDDRHDFKEAWNTWVEENEEIVNDEVNRLNTLGYDGDIIDKMFKSARYYFRKKSDVKIEPAKRRQYIKLSKDLLVLIDNHIINNIYNDGYKPKIGYSLFCDENNEILNDEAAKFLEQGINDKELIQEKIKKTYKNRYFILTNKTNKQDQDQELVKIELLN